MGRALSQYNNTWILCQNAARTLSNSPIEYDMIMTHMNDIERIKNKSIRNNDHQSVELAANTLKLGCEVMGRNYTEYEAYYDGGPEPMDNMEDSFEDGSTPARNWLWIGLGVAGLILVAFLIWYFVFRKEKETFTPRKIDCFHTYYTNLGKEDEDMHPYYLNLGQRCPKCGKYPCEC